MKRNLPYILILTALFLGLVATAFGQDSYEQSQHSYDLLSAAMKHSTGQTPHEAFLQWKRSKDEQRLIEQAKADAVWEVTKASLAAASEPASLPPNDPAPVSGVERTYEERAKALDPNGVAEPGKLEKFLVERDARDNETRRQFPGMFSEAKDHDCDCGPNCKCTGECHCEWPGQCLGVPMPESLAGAGTVGAGAPKSPAPPFPSQPARQTAAEINWLTSPEAGASESKLTGKPAIIYWTGQSCAPCKVFEAKVLDDPDVRQTLEQFVCVKVDAERWNSNPELKARLRKYGVRTIPAVLMVEPTWKNYKTLNRTNDPKEFIESVRERQDFSAKTVINRQRVPVRYALRQTLDKDYGEYASTETLSEPLEDYPTGWRPRATTQYASNGSAGGAGSNGGGYGWGSPVQPAHYQPRQNYYYQTPSYSGYYGGGWSGGGSCGPMGCGF